MERRGAGDEDGKGCIGSATVRAQDLSGFAGLLYQRNVGYEQVKLCGRGRLDYLFADRQVREDISPCLKYQVTQLRRERRARVLKARVTEDWGAEAIRLARNDKYDDEMLDYKSMGEIEYVKQCNTTPRCQGATS